MKLSYSLLFQFLLVVIALVPSLIHWEAETYFIIQFLFIPDLKKNLRNCSLPESQYFSKKYIFPFLHHLLSLIIRCLTFSMIALLISKNLLSLIFSQSMRVVKYIYIYTIFQAWRIKSLPQLLTSIDILYFCKNLISFPLEVIITHWF